MADNSRIELMAPLLQLGREELASWKPKDVKAIKRIFIRHFVREWWDQVIEWLNQNECGFGDSITEQSRSMELHVGIDRQTARRQLTVGSKQVVSLENYLATIVVFNARWPELEVRHPRSAVIKAMCQTLVLIQSLRRQQKRSESSESPSNETAAIHCEPLTSDQWELLRRVFRSEEWRDAASIKDPVARSQAIQKVSRSIVRDFHSSLTNPSVIQADALLELVRQWLPAWIMFFAAIPYRWRF